MSNPTPVPMPPQVPLPSQSQGAVPAPVPTPAPVPAPAAPTANGAVPPAPQVPLPGQAGVPGVPTPSPVPSYAPAAPAAAPAPAPAAYEPAYAAPQFNAEPAPASPLAPAPAAPTQALEPVAPAPLAPQEPAAFNGTVPPAGNVPPAGGWQQPAGAPQQAQQVYAPANPPAHRLKTKRGLLKYILLGIVTLGIYDIWQMTEISDSINIIANRRDGKRTMNYCLMFFLIGGLTLGIGWLVWFHKLSGRIGEEQQARNLPVTMTAGTFWLWDVLGIFIIVGPFIYYYKLLHAMNALSEDYNARG